MILKELLRAHADVVSLTTEHRIEEAAALMQAKRIGCVVVTENGNLVGVLTDRDIALGVSLGVATPESYVSGLMTRAVKTVSVSDTLAEVAHQFRLQRVKRFPSLMMLARLLGLCQPTM